MLDNIVEEIKECKKIASEAEDILDTVKDVFGYNEDKDGDFVEFCKKWTYDTPENNTVKLLKRLSKLSEYAGSVENEVEDLTNQVYDAQRNLEDIYLSEDVSNLRRDIQKLCEEIENPTTEEGAK
jgi:DNA repair ATPase RecN